MNFPDNPPYAITLKAADHLAKIAEAVTRLEFGTGFKRDTRLHPKCAIGRSETTVWRYLKMLCERGILESAGNMSEVKYHLRQSRKQRRQKMNNLRVYL